MTAGVIVRGQCSQSISGAVRSDRFVLGNNTAPPDKMAHCVRRQRYDVVTVTLKTSFQKTGHHYTDSTRSLGEPDKTSCGRGVAEQYSANPHGTGALLIDSTARQAIVRLLFGIGLTPEPN